MRSITSQRARAVLQVSVAFLMLALLACRGLAADREALFATPNFEEVPPNVEVLSEHIEEGVITTELYFAGGEFNGKPTRVYAFYARPEKPGKYPGVVQLHGGGMQELTSDVAVYYAQNGFTCISIDWCGPAKDRKDPRKPPYSEFESPGNLAAPDPDSETGHPWHTSPPEVSGITNGVRFVLRGFMFLRIRPEVDADRLCLSGMSAGAHLSLLVLGQDRTIRAAAVKYGCAFIRDFPGWFGGYYGPIVLAPREEQDEWLAVLDPKHDIPNYRASVLLLSGTDDIFFWMPLVLETYRAMDVPKRLIMLPNDNHSQVWNETIPLRYFESVFGIAPAFPEVTPPEATVEGDTLRLSSEVKAASPLKSVDFCVKQAPEKGFQWQKDWNVLATHKYGDRWEVKVPAPKDGERLLAYVLAEDETGAKASSDTVEVPPWPHWRNLKP